MTAAERHTATRAIASISVHKIVVPSSRMRQLRPELVAELAESIAVRGLLQPIVLRPRGATDYWLVAGRHRLEAVRQCGHDHIRAEIFDGLDADAALLAEIDENLVRADLSPAERALHLARRGALDDCPRCNPRKHGIRGKCELLLIGRRGDVAAPAPGEQLPALIAAPRGRHSEKPDIFAEEIARLFPNVPKLEMFARKARPGFDAWGNEAPSATEAAHE
jgi:uncharacterized ParB-like nuclease family protein